MLNKKGQTALELLIVLGGILIVGIVVVMILISTGSAKADDITQSDASHTQLLDKSVFPPSIDNLKCIDIDDGNLNIELEVIDSVSKSKKDYCLVINGETTEYCNNPISGKLFFNIIKIPENYYSIGVATRSHANTISSSSMTLSCSVSTPGTGTGTGIGTLNFTCPQGYTKVPGNSTYGTTYTKGGFCVMTWEAKVDTNNDKIGDDNPSCYWNYAVPNTSYPDYRYYIWFLKHTTNLDCNLLNKTVRVDYNIVSSAEGYPFTGASMTQANNFCTGIGTGYHLITNEEWMTVARNVENQSANWSTGAVGFGKFKIGNVYACSTTNSVYNMGSGPGKMDSDSSTSTYSKRGNDSPAKLVLSNGEIIWDFVGNAREWINKIIPCNQLPIGYDPNSYSQYIEFNQIQNNNSLQNKDYMPGTAGWLSDKGMGRIQFEWNGGASNCQFLSGPYIHSVYSACNETGLYTKAVLKTMTADLILQTIGFRCVYTPQ